MKIYRNTMYYGVRKEQSLFHPCFIFINNIRIIRLLCNKFFSFFFKNYKIW